MKNDINCSVKPQYFIVYKVLTLISLEDALFYLKLVHQIKLRERKRESEKEREREREREREKERERDSEREKYL